jgi:hypothetical protein
VNARKKKRPHPAGPSLFDRLSSRHNALRSKRPENVKRAMICAPQSFGFCKKEREMHQSVSKPVRTIPLECSLQGYNALRTFAPILVHPDGHSLGNSQVGSRTVPSGSFASSKAGVPIPWVRHRERALVRALECHPDLIDYRTYSHCLETTISGVSIRYVPAAAYDKTDGSVNVVSFAKPAKRTFDAVAAIYEKLGWAFRILDPAAFDVRTDSARFNARLLTYKHVEFSTSDSFTAQSILRAAGGRAQINELIAQLGGHPIGFAKLCAMHLNRQLVIEFDKLRDAPLWVGTPKPTSAQGTLTFKLWQQRHD